MCCLCTSLNASKVSTDCPFKLTYLKLHHEVCYRLVGYPQSFTLHNHPLPVDGILTMGIDGQSGLNALGV